MIKQAIEAFSLCVKKIEPNTKYAPGSPFYEFERLPGVVLEGPVLSEDRALDQSRVMTFRSVDGVYEKIPGPRHYDLDFTLTIIANRQQDLTRMMVDLTTYVTTEIDLVFPIDKPKYSCHMRFVSDFSAAGNENISGVCEAKATVKIEAVPLLSTKPVEISKPINSIRIEFCEDKGSVIDGTRVK